MRTKRFEGRLFVEDGCLFLVVSTDENEGTARVSCCLDGQRLVLEMPLADVSARISSSSSLALDNLNGPDAAKRLVKTEDGWHFSTREGLVGPHSSERDAARELGKYVLSMQSNGSARTAIGTSSRAPAARNSPRRRTTDARITRQAIG